MLRLNVIAYVIHKDPTFPTIGRRQYMYKLLFLVSNTHALHLEPNATTQERLKAAQDKCEAHVRWTKEYLTPRYHCRFFNLLDRNEHALRNVVVRDDTPGADPGWIYCVGMVGNVLSIRPFS
jgi:hypothetical protein